jgi:pimeloyl-ACP methyl ester carboxylesterase
LLLQLYPYEFSLICLCALGVKTVKNWCQTTFPAGRQYLTIQDANDQSVQIAYREKGQGIPVVLCHGIGSWGLNWQGVVAAMEFGGGLVGHRLIVFDAKGYGFSEKPERPEQPGHQMVELERILEGLCGGEPAVLVGESLGALTALGLAQRRPDLVRQLVLINVPIFPKQLPSWGMQAISAFPIEVVRWADRLRVPRLLAPLVRQVTAIAGREIVADPSRIKANSEGVYWATYPYIYEANAVTKYAEDLQIAVQEIQDCVAGRPSLIGQIQSQLSETQTPCLVLWGDRDSWFPVADGERLVAQLPQARLEVLERCGHQASGDQPVRITQLLLAFTQAFGVESGRL